MTILLEDYDPSRRAVIEPEMVVRPVDHFPDTAVTCFSIRIIKKMLELYGGTKIAMLDTEDGGVPVYKVLVQGKELAVYMSRVGAPAAAVQMEEMIALGTKKFVVFGSCGALSREIAVWHLIIPTAALRDEGVSYHYLPAADEIDAQPRSVELLKRVFDRHGQTYVCGKVWTTDAIYRETAAKTAVRGEQGCLVVDMESAALHAIAEFRGVRLAQFFYAEDNLDAPVWESRGLSKDVHTVAHELLALAFACALEL